MLQLNLFESTSWKMNTCDRAEIEFWTGSMLHPNVKCHSYLTYKIDMELLSTKHAIEFAFY